MWELDQKENWALKNWCFWTVVLEKTLKSPLDCKEIKPVNPKRNQSWIFIGRIDAEAEAPIIWLSDAKRWLIWQDPEAGKGWRQEEKGMTEDGWMASPTQWTWVWASSGSWWWTGKPGVLQSMGSQRVRHNCETELNWYITQITNKGLLNSTRNSTQYSIVTYLSAFVCACSVMSSCDSTGCGPPSSSVHGILQ